MKKKFSVLFSLVFIFSIFVGCSSQKTSEEAGKSADNSQNTTKSESINIAALKGPTSMGIVKLMSDEKDKYNFSISNSPDEVIPKIVNKELDIAAVPSNAASILYNKTKGQVVTLAINTLGVLYVVENGDSIKSIDDLKNKTVYSSGKGQVPEYVFDYIMKENNIDPKSINVQFKSEHSETLSDLLNDENGVAVLPQPFVTVAQSKKTSLRIVLDLAKEWEKVNKGSSIVTGVVVARKDFIEKNPDKVAEFLDGYKKSVQFTNSNIDEASKLIASYDIVPEAVAKKAIPMCNITYIDGNEMKTKLGGYLEVLFNANKDSIGGKMPGEDFYYIQKN